MNRKTGVLLSYILMVFEVLSTLLLTPFIIRTLGQSEYGVYKLAAAINAYVLLLDLGLGNAVIRYSAKYRADNDIDNGRKFIGVATIYYSIVAALSLLAGGILVAVFPTVFAVGLSNDEIILGQELLGVTIINSAITLGTATFPNALLAYERFVVSKGTSIVLLVFRMLCTWAALKIGFGSMGIVVVNLLVTIITRTIYMIYVFFGLKLIPKFKGIDWKFVKGIVAYSSLILLQMIATQLNATVDQVLIGALVSSSAVIIAVYGVGAQIVQYYQSMGTAFNGVLMAGIMRLVKTDPSPETLTKEMVRVGRIVFMVLGLLFVGFLAVGKEFVILWAGIENEQAYYVTSLLMLAYLFIYTESIGSQILWAMNKHKEQAIAKFVIVVCNIGLTILLIKWDAIIGATLGTFIALVFGDIVVLNIIFHKKMGFLVKRYYLGLFRGIVPCLLISGIIGGLINYYLHGDWKTLIIKTLMITSIYTLLLILYGMNDYERNLLNGLLQNISIKHRNN